MVKMMMGFQWSSGAGVIAIERHRSGSLFSMDVVSSQAC